MHTINNYNILNQIIQVNVFLLYLNNLVLYLLKLLGLH